jgi:hypothetical protein
MFENVSKVIQEVIFGHEDICDDAHLIWVALKEVSMMRVTKRKRMSH